MKTMDNALQVAWLVAALLAALLMLSVLAVTSSPEPRPKGYVCQIDERGWPTCVQNGRVIMPEDVDR